MADFEDPAVRREMAALLRRFARGAVTVKDFEAEAERLGDRDSTAYDAYLFAWCFYDDFKTERLTGKWRLSPEARRLWAKWVLFLMAGTDPYVGPELTDGCLRPFAFRLGYVLLGWLIYARLSTLYGLAMLAVWMAAINRIELLTEKVVDVRRAPVPDYWPFPSQATYDSAVRLANPFAASGAPGSLRLGS